MGTEHKSGHLTDIDVYKMATSPLRYRAKDCCVITDWAQLPILNIVTLLIQLLEKGQQLHFGTEPKM